MEKRTFQYTEDPIRTEALEELVAIGVFTNEDVKIIRLEDKKEAISKRESEFKDIFKTNSRRNKKSIQISRSCTDEERIIQYREESGIGEILDNIKKFGEHRVNEFTFARSESLTYFALQEDPYSQYVTSIEIEKNGTIFFNCYDRMGTGRTVLKERKWKKKPHLVGKAAEKAFKNPKILPKT